MKKFSEALKYQKQIDRNYQMFKQAIGLLVKNVTQTEEEKSYLYNKAKADLYNIDWDYNVYDPVGLEQTIEEYEWVNKRDSYNQSKDYYERLGVRS